MHAFKCACSRLWNFSHEKRDITTNPRRMKKTPMSFPALNGSFKMKKLARYTRQKVSATKEYAALNSVLESAHVQSVAPIKQTVTPSHKIGERNIKESVGAEPILRNTCPAAASIEDVSSST